MDSLIRNGLLITSKGRYLASVGILDGRIAGIYEPGQEPEAKEVIDASGLAILPGVIDMHSHHREGSESGFEYKDTIYTSTQQCAAGGVTTSVAMPNVTPPPNSYDLLKKQFAIYERDAIVDWNFNPAPTIEDEIPRMAEQGIAAFKIFMVVDTGRSYPHMPGIGVHDHGKILEIMQHCAKVNVPLMIHPHDQALMDVIEKSFWERQEHDALAYAKYATLDEAEIKNLVVDDKWLTTMSEAIHSELDRVSQVLAKRVKELAERYGVPAPEIALHALALESKVGVHLERMGYLWG